MYPFIQRVTNNEHSILIQDKENANNTINTIILPTTRKSLCLTINSNETIQFSSIDSLFLNHYLNNQGNQELMITINVDKYFILENVLPDVSQMPKNIKFNKKYGMYVITVELDIQNESMIVQLIYTKIIVPLLKYILESNKYQTLVIETNYYQQMHPERLTTDEFDKFINVNNLHLTVQVDGSVENYLVGITNILPIGYAKWGILKLNEYDEDKVMAVEASSSFTI